MDFDLSNYNNDELLNILDVNNSGDYSLENIFSLTKNSMESTKLDNKTENKEKIIDFLIKAFKRLSDHFNHDVPNYMLLELDRLKTKIMTNNEGLDNDPSNFVINHSVGGSGMYTDDDTDLVGGIRRVGNDRTGRSVEKKKFASLNPIKREVISRVLTVNTKYRNNYYGTKSSDFTFTIPNPIKNVTALKISNAELQNTYYPVSNYLKTNVFFIKLTNVNLDSSKIDSGLYKIELPEGNYNLQTAVDEINGISGFGLHAAKLMPTLDRMEDLADIIKVTLVPKTQKIVFSLANEDLKHYYKFDLDFTLPEDPERDIARNLGWLLGFKKPYYSFIEQVIDDVVIEAGYKSVELDTVKGVCVTHPGFQPEAPADFTGTKFFLIEVSDFNNNSIQSFYYPSTFNELNMKDLMGKIPNNVLATILFEDSYGPNNPTRFYQGPVNIEKLKIRLLDEHGIVIDLNNIDFTITFELEILNVHYKMIK